MIKRLTLLVTVCYLVLPAAVAAAHPLGNFTINRFARVEVAGDTLYVRYVVDMAEIPTLQGVRPRFDGLSVRLDGGRPAPLCVIRTSVAHPRAAAGLRTTRVSMTIVSTGLGAALGRRCSARSTAPPPPSASRASASASGTASPHSP